MTPNEIVTHVVQTPFLLAFAILFVTTLISLMISWAIRSLLGRIAARTVTDLDDELIEDLSVPLTLSLALGGATVALSVLSMPSRVEYVLHSALFSAIVLTWSVSAWRAISVLLKALVANQDRFSLVRPRTVPIFEVSGRFFVFASALYFFFLAWDVDLTAWVASAGVLGLAVGFAAQETLGNVVAGVFILIEAPYKLGDYLTLDGGQRGKVVEIGIRTTRLLTLDEVEVIVPNQLLANSKVTNESGGPSECTRVHIDVGVAYGSDIEQVRQLLLDVAGQSSIPKKQPAPTVQFTEFGDSSLVFRLLVWAPPAKRNILVDDLNTRIYQALNQANIEIPFPQRDVWVRTPTGPSDADAG